MHHGPEMSSVSLLMQPFSITPTLTPSRDEEKEKRGKRRHEEEAARKGKERRNESVRTCRMNASMSRTKTV